MSEPTERDLIKGATELLRKHEATLDELTIARLRAARLRALDARSARWRTLAATTAVGLALALAGIVWFRAPAELPVPPSPEIVADLDLLTSESPDFYEDLEFYRWLATQPDAS